MSERVRDLVGAPVTRAEWWGGVLLIVSVLLGHWWITRPSRYEWKNAGPTHVWLRIDNATGQAELLNMESRPY